MIEQPSDSPGLLDLLMEGWGVIANAPDAWAEDSEWRQAAIRWRDKFHAALDAHLSDHADGIPND